MSFIPVNRPLITEDDVFNVQAAMTQGWISSDGPYVEDFEARMAALFKRKYAIAVSNGTFAVDAVIESMNLAPGDEVILPTLTIISCLSQVLRTGATPVFVDCDKRTYNVSAEDVIGAITEKTKLIILVNIYGLTVDYDPILKEASARGISVLEDVAQSIGVYYKEKITGSLCDFSTISLFANKNITTGEGGMIFTDDVKKADEFRRLRNLAFDLKHRFVHHSLGWNGRLTTMQAALGISQLSKLQSSLERRKRIANLYNELLRDDLPIRKPLKKTAFAENGYWVYAITIKFSHFKSAHEYIEYLSANNIGARPFFFPLHKQPVLRRFRIEHKELPIASELYNCGLYLPSGLGNTDMEIATVAEFLNRSKF